MNYNILRSLQHMAAVKIAVEIFYDNEIEEILLEERKYPRVLMGVEFNHSRHELWKLIQTKAIEKLPGLAASLQTRVYNCIHALYAETEDWIRDHTLLLNLDPLHCPLACKSNLCWKSDGTINRVETAKKIAQNKNIDANDRFILACTYFLEDEVLGIWNEDGVSKRSLRRKGTNSAVRFWMKWLRKSPVMPWKLMIDDYFSVPCFRRSDIPLRFSGFFNYLSQESKEIYLEYFNYRLQCFHKDEFFSYLCIMDEEESTELVQLIPQDALEHCLKWPFQTMFIEMVKQLESHGKDLNFYVIFCKIVANIVFELHDFDYAELVRELWNVSFSFKKEIEGCEIFSKIVEAILNYDKDNQSLLLAQLVDQCIRIRNI
ncbi:unnamed protein product [Larinioides sclopetarius]|uniref:Uncharacterized protein n=1 Tax=Larinioides sclopetarius TaxID=280406 RepID=A0AAV2B7L8_9ARAC